MAIILKESKFTDIYGNITNNFKANAGDLINVKHKFETEISFITTIDNQLKFEKLQNRLTRANGSFLQDGFREGQTYVLTLIENINVVHDQWTGTILSVQDLSMTMTGLPNLNNVYVGNEYIGVLRSTSDYDSLNFAFNFSDNDIPSSASPSLESFIDGETSRFIANSLNSMLVGDTIDLVQIGKKSGQFTVNSATVTRLANTVNPYTAFNSIRKNYEISLDVIFTGMYVPDSFIGQKCLKYYSKTSFKVLNEENLAPTIIEYNEKANTGLWNEGFNEDKPNSTNNSTIDTIYFNDINELSFTATCETSLGIDKIEIGAFYLTNDDEFAKNLENPQDYYLPLLKTGLINDLDIDNDWTSTGNHPFNISLVSFSYADSGGERLFNVNITLNPFYNNNNGFGKFVEKRGELDREFLLWVKVGNTNRLIFGNQLTKKLPVGKPFTSLYNFINHDNNIDYKNLDNINLFGNSDFNIEDDIAYVSEFSLFTYDVNESITASVVVKNSQDNFEFVLDKIVFDISNQDLQYFTNMYVPVINNLPDSSNKKEAFLIERSALSVNEMEVRLFYPFLIDWRYWEEVFQTHPYFVSKNKNNNNWFNYVDGFWKVYVKVDIQRNGVSDYSYNVINFNDYDDSSVTSTIELFDENETKISGVILQDTRMLIKATHVAPSAFGDYPYGMITIEPQQSSPRYILSTEINRVQLDNPLIGISEENRCDMQLLNPNTIILRCYVDTNLLNGRNFCITSKISDDGTNNNLPLNNKLTEQNDDKITEDVEFKIIE